MNTAISYEASIQDSYPSPAVSNLVVELDHYKRRSEWLLLVNGLHGRLAAALDLGSMIEAFSVWLMPLVDHDLLAYCHPDRRRHHVFCSSHGPDRRAASEAAEKLFALIHEGKELPLWEGGFHVAVWQLDHRRGKGHLLLLRQEPFISPRENRVVEATLDILTETLRRALDYEDLYDQARRDTLTGLANRHVLEERLPPMLEGARRHRHPLTIASMDLDNFKTINDTLGHAKGDQTLQLVARTMAGMVRQSDLLVRTGGDEFLLVLPDTSVAAAEVLAGRLCKAVDELAIGAGGQARLGISVGLSQWQPGYALEEWLQRADENLYRAKAAGRSRVCAA
ncbi:MAG: GGDEF domain-containing protein [Desulfobacteraceae bacterium]|nr:GGDEF domain-containing protein [Desulfobacteraceae bacterium]